MLLIAYVARPIPNDGIPVRGFAQPQLAAFVHQPVRDVHIRRTVARYLKRIDFKPQVCQSSALIHQESAKFPVPKEKAKCQKGILEVLTSLWTFTPMIMGSLGGCCWLNGAGWDRTRSLPLFPLPLPSLSVSFKFGNLLRKAGALFWPKFTWFCWFSATLRGVDTSGIDTWGASIILFKNCRFNPKFNASYFLS